MRAARRQAAQLDVARFHSRVRFSFMVAAPLRRTWPLFGAQGERAWVPGWNPKFVWPQNPLDQQGMVFEITHGEQTAVWINTAFDRLANRVQYVYVIPEVVATVISLNLSPEARSTRVSVLYERSALSGEADAIVRGMAGADRAAGKEWSRQIARYLAKCRVRPSRVD